MHKINKTIINLLLKVYDRTKSHKIRKFIKWYLKGKDIEIIYKNVRFKVQTASSIEFLLIFNEYNETNIIAIIQYLTRKSYSFIDIGANIGIHSLMASKANSNIKIYSFEPEPSNYKRFTENIKLNYFSNNISAFNLGLGNIIETKNLNINGASNKGKHSLKRNFGSENTQIPISIERLDSFKNLVLPTKSLLIKIDVEGFEMEVIDGAVKFLKSIDEIVIIIELLEEINTLKGCRQIYDRLFSDHFDVCYKITEKGIRAVTEYASSGDYLFLKGNESKGIFNEFLL